MRSKQFDLLLTDLMMPEMDGITLLRAALEMDANLVGIIMTGHGTIDTAVEAMKTGALDYILKPFKLSVILPVLSRALAVRRLRLENAELEQRVRERTAELEAANQELEAFSLLGLPRSARAAAPHRRVRGAAREAPRAQPRRDGAALPHARSPDAAKQMGELIDDLLAFSRIGPRGAGRDPRGPRGAGARGAGGSSSPRPPGANRLGRSAICPRCRATRSSCGWCSRTCSATPSSTPAPRPEARIEIGASARGRPRPSVRPRQRRGLRHALRGQAVRRLPAPAHARRVRGHGHRPRHRAAHRPAARRAGVGGRGGRSRARAFISPCRTGASLLRPNLVNRRSAEAGGRPPFRAMWLDILL